MSNIDPTKSYHLIKEISDYLKQRGFAVTLHEFMPNCQFSYRYEEENYTCYISVDSITMHQCY